MTRLPRTSGKKIVSALQKIGFVVLRIKGSHYSMKHNDGRFTVIPVHGHEIVGPGLLSKILKDCELSVDELIKLL